MTKNSAIAMNPAAIHSSVSSNTSFATCWTVDVELSKVHELRSFQSRHETRRTVESNPLRSYAGIEYRPSIH